MYDDETFCTRFRMTRTLFTSIVREITDNCLYFQQNSDFLGDEVYLYNSSISIRHRSWCSRRISTNVAQKNHLVLLKLFVWVYGDGFFWRPIHTDIEKLHAFHERNIRVSWDDRKHWCTHVSWANWPLHIVLKIVGVIIGLTHSFYWKQLLHRTYEFGMRSFVQQVQTTMWTLYMHRLLSMI